MTWFVTNGAWLAPLAACFVLWSTYTIPGKFAQKVHGVPVNFMFEALAFAGVVLLLSGKIVADLPKVTWTSGFYGSLMGLGSAVGFYFFLQALNLAPGTSSVALILLVAGITFPVQGALFSLKIFGGEPLSTQQWIALLGMGGCIALYNLKF
jgi:drug/metabolite transporter (DMT)-like permease